MTQRGLYDGNVGDALGFENACDPVSPDTMCRRSMSRVGLTDTVPGIATGRMVTVPVTLEGGDLVTSIAFVLGATGATSPTAWWVALYRPDGTLMAQSADQGSATLVTGLTKTLALTTAQRIPYSGIYEVAIVIVHGGANTYLGAVVAPAIAAGERSFARESASATYTTTAPATLPTLQARTGAPYVVCV